MPRVTLYKGGQVQRQGTTEARFRAADYGDGLWAVEAASAVNKVLQEEIRRKSEQQEIANDVEARQKALSWQEGADAAMAEASVAKGLDAGPAKEAAIKKMEGLRSDIERGTGNPVVQRMIRERVDPMLVQFRGGLERHQQAETFSAADATFQAQARQAGETAVRNLGDPQIADQQIEAGLRIIEERGDLLGRGAEAIADDANAYRSSVRRAMFERLAAEGRWDDALGFHDNYAGEMIADDTTAIAGTLRSVRENRQAYVDGTGILAVDVPASDLPKGGAFAMPVAGGTVTSAFGAARGARAHNGVDWAAPEGTAVKPMAPGRVVTVSSDERSGKFVVIDHGGGLTTSYSHLGNQSVKVGDTVAAGAAIGAVGMTGRTTGPHVHVVARQNGKPVDPVSLLGRSAPGGGATAGTGWDQKAAHVAIDRQAGWSFERKQRAKDWIDREFSQRDQMEAREEREADKRASEIVLNLGERFKSMEMLDKALRDTMSVGMLQSLTNTAERNAAPKPPQPYGVDFFRLSEMAISDPEEFASQNLGPYVGRLTPSELFGLREQQVKFQKGGQQAVNLTETIENTIKTFALPELKISGSGLDRLDRIRVHDQMETYLRTVTSGKRQPTSAELRDALNVATRNVVTVKPGVLWGTNREEKRVFDLTIDDVPKRERDLARTALEQAGQEASDEAVVSLYLQKRARLHGGG